jgi:hypothetical protein
MVGVGRQQPQARLPGRTPVCDIAGFLLRTEDDVRGKAMDLSIALSVSRITCQAAPPFSFNVWPRPPAQEHRPGSVERCAVMPVAGPAVRESTGVPYMTRAFYA